MVNCPECGADLDIDYDLEEGQTLSCPECQVELEVVNTQPPELAVTGWEEEEEEEEEELEKDEDYRDEEEDNGLY